MGTEIDKIHHVGHVVQDMETALELYRKLGFVCTLPAYPTMAEQEGETPKPLGAANAHIDFVDNFIEINPRKKAKTMRLCHRFCFLYWMIEFINCRLRKIYILGD